MPSPGYLLSVFRVGLVVAWQICPQRPGLWRAVERRPGLWRAGQVCGRLLRVCHGCGGAMESWPGSRTAVESWPVLWLVFWMVIASFPELAGC